MSGTNWALWASAFVACLSCIVCMVTSITTITCTSKADWKCAQTSGAIALVFGCTISSLAAGFFYLTHKGHGSGL
jgi:hypothetical protein